MIKLSQSFAFELFKDLWDAYILNGIVEDKIHIYYDNGNIEIINNFEAM
jgi:hypothetical protein